MPFTPSSLLPPLAGLPSGSPLVVGFSGGLDSTVLLHALRALRETHGLQRPLRALHVDHGLHRESAQWAAHCAARCREWQVPFTAAGAAAALAEGSGGAGPEGAARRARYAVFESQLAPDETLLLAHHRDDQMETLLLRLMRGSGVVGLAGMPVARPLGAGMLLRPLLGFDRGDLASYASGAGLSWLTDPSNEELRLDRNYCRQRLLPAVEARWPGYRRSWGKSISLCADAARILREVAAADLAATGASADDPEDDTRLPLASLRGMNGPRRRNLLRLFAELAGFPNAGWNLLRQLDSHLGEGGPPARPDSHLGEGGPLARPGSHLGEGKALTLLGGAADGRSLRLFGDCLHMVPPLPPLPAAGEVPPWQPAVAERLELAANGTLTAEPVCGAGLRRDAELRFTVRYRQGGERCEMAGRPRKSLKALLREAGVKPWLRPRMPLLFVGDRLVCLPDIGVSPDLAAGAGEPGWRVRWRPPAGFGTLR